MGYVAIRAGSTHTGGVGIVNGLPVLLVHIVTHFMARNAECQVIGLVHSGVEAAPDDDAHEEHDDATGR